MIPDIARYAAILLTIAAFPTGLAAAELSQPRSMETKLVTSPARYRVLLPDDYGTSGKEYPLLFFLHGGEADATTFIENYAPVFKRKWVEGTAPKMVVVTPDAGRSFYLDSVDGKEKWETFLTTEFLEGLRSEYRVIKDRNSTYVAGMSMGGMGSLRLALKHPDLFGAVTALEPAIEPAFEWKDVRPIDKYWRSDELITSLYGNPPDERYRQNNPATIVRDNADRIRAAKQWIYFDAGSEDVFEFYKGADFLHNILREKGIAHEYHYVLGADHIGNSVPGRWAAAFAFLQRMGQPAMPDPALDKLRAEVLEAKRKAGLAGK